MDVVVEQAAGVAEAVSGATDNEFVMLDSMGMYLTLSEIRQGDERFAKIAPCPVKVFQTVWYIKFLKIYGKL